MLSTVLSTLWDIFLVLMLIIGIVAGASIITAILASVWVVVTRFGNAYTRASRELEDAGDELDPFGKLAD